jgi:hypothetical protein
MVDEDEVEVPESATSDEEHIDELPDDLDPSLAVQVTFPNNNRRRIPAALYVLIGAISAGSYLAYDGDTPLVNIGLLWAGIGLIVFGIYGWIAGRTLKIDEQQALVEATKQVGFAVGHASAQMTWRGVWSRPAWRLLLYSADDPPSQRAFVIVDGIDGTVAEWFAEANPEEWD